MNKLAKKGYFLSENNLVEYINIFIITALSTLLYSIYSVFFIKFTYNELLVVTQIISIFVCVAAFLVNHVWKNPRAATIIMIILVSSSIIIWAYTLDVGNNLRWYALLALCPLYFFSSLKYAEKVLLTILVLLSFIISSIIVNYHTPLMMMPNSDIFDVISSFVIIVAVAFELIIYRYVSTRRDNELKRIETILENIECGIIIIDTETSRILEVNPVALRIFGGSKDMINGADIGRFIIKAEADSDNGGGQNSSQIECEFVKADGSTVSIIKSSSRIWYSGHMASLESFNDISELKNAEMKLRHLEITERSNHAKSEFLSRMSHEMRTPMHAIIGMTKIAEGTDDINKLKYCLSTIGVSSKHLLGIINDVLDMSKIEAGKFDLYSAPLSIEKILMDISDVMSEKIDQKNIKFNVFLHSNTRMQYLGDELRISQVITNLLSNAVKFTPVGGSIQITVKEIRRESDFGFLRFTLDDTGIGMTDEQVGKLFNAFEQADGSITRQFGGTGLGLTISKSIIEKMDGRIWVTSTLGEGSSFQFEIRLQYVKNQNEKSGTAEKLIPGSKILIADSDENTVISFGFITEDYHIETDTAKDISALSDRLNLARKTRPYDVIFLDYKLFDINPFEKINELMNVEEKNKTVIMSSFLNWNKIAPEASSSGLNKFITKPLFFSAVMEMMNSISAVSENAPAKPAVYERRVIDFSEVHMLLVDDVDINREILVTILAETNIKIDEADNGLNALKKFQDDPDRYDMIIMDIQMPVMNGYEATEKIRSLGFEKAKVIPIIAMSADAFKEDINKCIACGMNDHLKKPIEFDLLMEKLSLYCGKEKPEI